MTERMKGESGSVLGERKGIHTVEIELSTPCRQGVGLNPYQVGHKPSDTLANPARASRSAPRGSNEDRGVSREVGCA